MNKLAFFPLISTVASVLLFVSPVLAGRMVQITPWFIEQSIDKNTCQAETALSFPNAMTTPWRTVLHVNKEGKSTLILQFPGEPKWMEFENVDPISNEKEPARICKYRFDEGENKNYSFSIDAATAQTRYDFSSSNNFIEDFSRSMYIKLEEYPGDLKIETDKSKRVQENNFTVFQFVKTDALKQPLSECIYSINNGKFFVPIQIGLPEDSSAISHESNSKGIDSTERLHKEVSSGYPQELISILAKQVSTHSDAMRYRQAKASAEILLSKTSGHQLQPSVIQAFDKYLELLMLCHEYEEAQKVASAIGMEPVIVAAIDIAQGQFEAGYTRLFSHFSLVLDKKIDRWEDLDEWASMSLNAEQADIKSAIIRKALKIIAVASLGLEAKTVDHGCKNCVMALGKDPVSSVFLAGLSFNWLDSRMLRASEENRMDHRRELGVAACIRGLSLLNAEYLQDVRTDLSYAQYELMDGPGAEGWAAQAEVALARMDAIQGATLPAHDRINALVAKLEKDLGTNSLAWAEAVAVQAELALALGDTQTTITLSNKCLESLKTQGLRIDHPLFLKLRISKAKAFSSIGKQLEMLRIISEMVGFQDFPKAEDVNQLNAFQQSMPQASSLLLTDLIKITDIPLTCLSNVDQQRGMSNIMRELRAITFNSSIKFSIDQDSFSQDLIQATDPRGDICTALKTKPGSEAYTRAFISFGVKEYNCFDFIKLSAMFPGLARKSLLSDKYFVGMENIVTYLLNNYIYRKTPSNEWFDLFLFTYAFSRGEVLSNILMKEELIKITSSSEAHAYALKALEGEFWLKRQRAYVMDSLKNAQKNSSSKGVARSTVRLAYIPLIHYEFVLNNQFSMGAGMTSQPSQEDMLLFFKENTHFSGMEQFSALKEWQTRLKPDDGMIIWLPLQTKTLTILVTKNTVKASFIPHGRFALEKFVLTLRNNIKDAMYHIDQHQQLPAFPAETAFQLQHILFDEFRDSLRNLKHLYVAPLGTLAPLPLNLLVTRTDSEGHAISWLIDEFAITRLPGLANPKHFLITTSAASKGRTLLAVGNPVVTTDRSVASLSRSLETKELNKLESLPNSHREMNAVADALGLKPEIQKDSILSGETATRHEVLAKLKNNSYKYLLFSTHGLIGGENVGEPALVLSPPIGGRTIDDDGLLRTSDIIRLKLNTDLTMLSACNTSSGGGYSSEPLAGLASAFLLAGSKYVLSTQWKIDTNAAEQITTSLIKIAIDEKTSFAKSLCKAMHLAKSKKDYNTFEAHPVYWAPFEVVGIPR